MLLINTIHIRLLLTFFISLYSNSLFSQEYSITGNVVDNQGNIVEFGKALLLNEIDSLFIAGSTIDSANFEFNNVSNQKVLLKITSYGMETKFINIDNSSEEDTVNLGTINLKIKTFEVVDVIANRPTIKNEGDRISITIENTMLSNAGTALEVLESCPGVMVNENTVSVFGKGVAIIYLDGQRIPPEFLSTITSDQIKKIEVITEPSAKYDAQGKAVINILSKKFRSEGYNLSILSNNTWAKYYKNYSSVNFNLKRNSFTFFARYVVFIDKRWNLTKYNRSFEDSTGLTTNINNEIINVAHNPFSHYSGLGMSWNIDSVSNVGLWANGALFNSNTSIDNTNLITSDNGNMLINTSSDADLNIQSFNTMLYYNRKIDTIGSDLQTDFSYSYRNNKNFSEINEEFTDSLNSSLNKRNENSYTIETISTKVNYIKGFTKKLKLENGIKLWRTSNLSSVNLQNEVQPGKWVVDSTVLSDFDYREQFAAAYSQLKYTDKKWRGRIGLRMEYSDIDGVSNYSNNSIVDTTYLNLFPNLFLAYNMNDNWTANLNYNYRINRPLYQDLYPFINYIDSVSAFIGNPDLLPEFTHSASMSFIFKKMISIKVGYSNTNNAMNLFVDKLDDGSNMFFAQKRNFDKHESGNLQLSFPISLKAWHTTNTAGFDYNRYLYNLDNNTYITSTPTFFLNSYQRYTFSKNFSLECLLNYSSAQLDGIFSVDPIFTMRLGTRLQFNNFTIVIIGNDLTFGRVTRGKSLISGFEATYAEYSESRSISVSLKYSFGKMKNITEEKINEDQLNRIK